MSDASLAVPGSDDPLVWAMAYRNHQPSEEWVPINRVIISCGMCGQAWPCATRKAINEFEKATAAKP